MKDKVSLFLKNKLSNIRNKQKIYGIKGESMSKYLLFCRYVELKLENEKNIFQTIANENSKTLGTIYNISSDKKWELRYNNLITKVISQYNTEENIAYSYYQKVIRDTIYDYMDEVVNKNLLLPSIDDEGNYDTRDFTDLIKALISVKPDNKLNNIQKIEDEEVIDIKEITNNSKLFIEDDLINDINGELEKPLSVKDFLEKEGKEQ